MSDLRERVNELICDVSEGWREVGEVRDAILALVAEDRAALADALRHVKAHAHMAPETERIVVEALAGVKGGTL